MADAVCLDVDGLLIDAFKGHYFTYNEAFVSIGYRKVSVGEMRKYWFLPGKEMVRCLLGKSAIDEEVNEIVEIKRKLYLEEGEQYIIILPGAVELIEAIYEYERDIPIAITSSGSRSAIEIALEKMGVADKIYKILSIEDVVRDGVIRSKPDSEVYIMAAKALGNCLVFEDSAEGVCAAKGAYQKCVAVATGTSSREELEKLQPHPDCILSSLNEALPPRLEELLAL